MNSMQLDSEQTTLFPKPVSNFPFGSSEMADLIRQHNWSQTPIGPLESWPMELCFTTNLILASKFPMAILWGQDLIFIYNEGYKLLINHKHPSAIGKSSREVWPEVWEFNSPIFEKVLRSGDTIHLEDQAFRINRNWPSEETFFTLCYSPIRLLNNSIGGVLVVLQETTRYVLSERRIREGEQLLRNIINSSPSHIFAVDTENRYTIANKALADFCNYPQEKMIGSKFQDLFNPEVALKLETINNEVMKNGLTKYFEEEVKTKSGNNFIQVMTSKFPIKNDAGKIIGMGGVATDISERKRLEDQLIEAKNRAEEIAKLKSQFLDTAAHELRTPVTVISFLVDIFQRNIEHSQVIDEKKLKQLRDAISRLTNLINDLLDLSRLERGLIKINKEKVNLHQLIKKCVDELCLLDPKRVIRIYPVELKFEVYVDRTRMTQVLYNLLDNAMKYTPDNSPIDIMIEPGNETLRVSIQDKGPGIPNETLQNLFQAFCRGNSPLNIKASGLGLGLSISKGIIELHGGQIGVRSELGKGSTFYFVLPTEKRFPLKTLQ